MSARSRPTLESKPRGRTWSGEALALEDMSKMSAAGGTSNLRTRHTVRAILVAVHGTWDSCMRSELQKAA